MQQRQYFTNPRPATLSSGSSSKSKTGTSTQPKTTQQKPSTTAPQTNNLFGIDLSKIDLSNIDLSKVDWQKAVQDVGSVVNSVQAMAKNAQTEQAAQDKERQNNLANQTSVVRRPAQESPQNPMKSDENLAGINYGEGNNVSSENEKIPVSLKTLIAIALGGAAAFGANTVSKKSSKAETKALASRNAAIAGVGTSLATFTALFFLT